MVPVLSGLPNAIMRVMRQARNFLNYYVGSNASQFHVGDRKQRGVTLCKLQYLSVEVAYGSYSILEQNFA